MGIPQIGTCRVEPLAFESLRKKIPERSNQSAPLLLIPRGRVLFWEGEHQAQKIQVVKGVVRAVQLLENGDRQILTFFWPGHVIMPTRSSCQQITAEAVTNCLVQRSTVASICQDDDPCGARQILTDTLALVATRNHKNSVARIANFLLRIRKHLPCDPKRPLALSLLLPRADIADHLGTSIETVCRILADFKMKGLIDLPNRKTIRYLDLPGLLQVAGD
jgi:CRP-like cAMP-binding protein